MIAERDFEEQPQTDLPLDRVRAIHRRAVKEWWNGVPVYACSECGQPWPCRTAELLGQ